MAKHRPLHADTTSSSGQGSRGGVTPDFADGGPGGRIKRTPHLRLLPGQCAKERVRCSYRALPPPMSSTPLKQVTSAPISLLALCLHLSPRLGC